MNKLLKQFNIIPVSGKKPAIKWQEYTTRKQTDEERNKFISNKEIGIVTGKVSGIFVLDDDGGLNGQAKKLPKTLIQKTPRGGTHYLFNWVPELDNKITTKLGVYPKVDTRGDGGYIKYYGFKSLIPGVMKIADPPQWLIDLLPSKDEPTKPQTETNPSSYIVDLLDNIEPGNGSQGRTPTFVKVINILKKEGMTEQRVLEYLTPWAEKYEYTRLEYLVKDQYKRYPQPRAFDTEADSIDSFLSHEEHVSWIVPDLIAKNSIGFIAGLPETGKTWMLIDLAIEASRSNGGVWLGKYPVNPARVLFVDQERFKGETQRRFKAVINGKNLSPKELQDNLFIRCGTSTRIDLQHSFEAFRKELNRIRPDIVMIDSFATFHTKDENNRQSVQDVLERVKELRHEIGCTFIFIHHENKNAFDRSDNAGEPSIAQMAGNVAIPAAAETVMTVRKQDDSSSMVYHTKSTLSSTHEPFLVRVNDLDESKSKIQVVAY